MLRLQGRCILRGLTGGDSRPGSANAGFDFYDDERDNEMGSTGITNASDYIVDIREYDVPYHVRVAIDKGRRFAS